MSRKTTKTAAGKPPKNVGDRIIDGLTELRDALRSGAPLERGFTVRTVEVPEPELFDAKRIRTLRQQLQVSQSVFARLVGISTVLAQSWEQGVREPSPLARRLLGEIERDPKRWRRMVIMPPANRAAHGRKSA
jgi:putative transcriptional regulator